MFCRWKTPTKKNGRWVYVCQLCQQEPLRLPYLHDDPQTLRRNCPAELKLPSTLRRIGNFSIASIKHRLNGCPTCTQEQIDARFAICQACEWLKDGVCAHKKCGCGIKNVRGYISKLAWADQECPVGKWGRVDEEESDEQQFRSHAHL